MEQGFKTFVIMVTSYKILQKVAASSNARRSMDCTNTFFFCVFKYMEPVLKTHMRIHGLTGAELHGCSYLADLCVREVEYEAVCVEVVGGAVCQCPPGMQGDGIQGNNHTGCQYPSCPLQMQQYGQSCYNMMSNQTQDFYDARKVCWGLGGELMSLHSQQELDLLREYALRNNMQSVWLGYTDVTFEGVFVWMDGTAGTLQYGSMDWSQNTHTHDCVAMDVTTDNTTATIKSCDEQAGFVCKRPLFETGCVSGWKLIDGMCYSVTQQSSSYLQAYMSCVGTGGDLLHIQDNEMFSYIQQLTQELDTVDVEPPVLWVGLQYGYMSPQYAWTADVSGVVEYPADLPVNVSGQMCYSVQADMWASHLCHNHTAHGFICQKSPHVSEVCPGESVRFGSECHKIKESVDGGWLDGRQACVNMGGDLLIIDSPAKQQFIANLLTNNNANNSYWIGLHESDVDGNYTWVNGLPGDNFTSWSVSQPDDNNTHNCVLLSATDTYNWNDANCEVQLPVICQYKNTPCREDASCHSEVGECSLGQCRCQAGYIGDGSTVCTDVDECLLYPCHLNATCTNNNGSYHCQCDPGFQGSGLHCQSMRACSSIGDCHISADCVTGLCQCNHGYQGDGKYSCVDIDECTHNTTCHVNANCHNTNGSYTCTCKAGYYRSGYECLGLPRDCDMVRELLPGAESGVYNIDPDGDGDITAFQVVCEFYADYSVTVVSNADSRQYVTRNVAWYSRELSYVSATIRQLIALTARSHYCYQTITFSCKKVSLMETTYYKDSANTTHTITQCPCGVLGACESQGACTCDGSGKGSDMLTLTSADTQLPLTHIMADRISKTLSFTVSSLKCAPVQIDIPKDCHDAKMNYKVKKNSVMYIDVDGPAPVPGNSSLVNLPPVLVYCDVESYKHVGVTVIPAQEPSGTPTQPGAQPITYPVDTQVLLILTHMSGFCMQGLTYICENSALLAAGSTWTDIHSVVHEYWPSTADNSSMCACGVTQSCTDAAHKCNCDIRDNTTRRDFGMIVNAEELPVWSVNIQDVESGMGRYQLTGLQCAPQQFGIPVSCQDYRNMGYDYSYTYLVDPDGPPQTDQEENMAPFLVECEMTSEPPTGCEIIPNANTEQLMAILGRYKASAAGHCTEIGDDKIKCCEIYSTCAALAAGYKRVHGEHKLPDGRYVIDPDGINIGVHPFQVYCDFPKTILLPTEKEQHINSRSDVSGPSSSCTNITYEGDSVSTEQLRKLTEVSGYCSQYAEYKCRYAPLTNYSHWTSRDGQPITGWSGAGDSEECACGSQDICVGGPHSACNCDANTSNLLTDHGTFTDKTLLPVSQVCLGYSEGLTSDQYAYSYYKLGKFVCAPQQFAIEKSCQMYRNRRHTSSEVYLVDPDGHTGPSLPFPAVCHMTQHPPMGVTVITHIHSDSCMSVPDEGGEVVIDYNSVTVEQLLALTSQATYCTQQLYYQCNSTTFNLNTSAGEGWYNVHGQLMPYWSDNTGGTGCAGGSCQCDEIADNLQDAGILVDKTVLPVTKIKLGPVTAGGQRCVKLGPLKCKTMYRTCDEMLENRAWYNANRDSTYVIDPDLVDQPDGGVQPFEVTCDLKTVKKMGITIVGDVTSHTAGSSSHKHTVSYPGADHSQLTALVHASQACKQSLVYSCNNVPLLNNHSPAHTYYTYGETDQESMTWPAADTEADAEGCACAVLGTCPHNNTCHCDSYTGQQYYHEGGYIINRTHLPVRSVVTGAAGSGSAYYTLQPLHCAPRVWGFPVDCEAARVQGYVTGEVQIQPSTDVKPFLVYCDMDSYPTMGVTVVGASVQGQVEYTGASHTQVTSLLLASHTCYLPVKLSCIHTQFSAASHWVGAGDSSCWCGEQGRCVGPQPNNRLCNCDVGDGVWRADAGVLELGSVLPDIHLSLGSHVNASAHLRVGSLYCAPAILDVDECSVGFSDCHMWADCVNLPGSYDCVCRPGYQARGRTDVWANGRECYDDNECALNACPVTADCVNTVGSFTCHCKPGFINSSPTTCADIDECAEGTDRCDVNARCINTYGGHRCVCDDGYRGDGVSCESIATCKCWGDPHCQSYDNKYSHFQGDCTYLMSRDGCSEGLPDDNKLPTFQVMHKFWRNSAVANNRVSWVKEVYVHVYGHVISLLQAGVVLVDGEAITRLPSRPLTNHTDLTISKVGHNAVVRWSTGIEVKWSGTTVVEVVLPSSYQNQTCGMCGNYNGQAHDDWIVGPACPNSAVGQTTLNENEFGHSWLSGEDSECEQDCSEPPQPPCNGEVVETALAQCKVLTDPQGVFMECIAELAEETVSELFTSCVFDMCHTDNDMSVSLCENAQVLADKCQSLGFTVNNWRANGLCAVECPEGQVYNSCGSACVEMCYNVSVSTCEGPCVAGCECPDGLIMDGDRCVTQQQCGCEHNGLYYSVGDRVVTDECSTQCHCESPLSSLRCEPLTCHQLATCHSRDGVTDCYCEDGYSGDGQNCTDINECDLSPSPCSRYASCENMEGTYNCTCNDGYRGDGHHCADIDECAEGTDNCDDNAECVNKPGRFKCRCKQGYSKQGPRGQKTCQDVDECESGRDECDRQTTHCVNEQGSYQCQCNPGYTGPTHLACTDLDECSNSSLNSCLDSAICYNSIGSYSCGCESGLRGDGVESCVDVDECSEGNHQCDEAAQCDNTHGSYNCTCKPGYEGDGRSCTGLPCTRDCGELGEHSQCAMEEGVQSCVCSAGYTMSTTGDVCEDVDECTSEVCDPHADCTNTVGSYVCICEAGYTGDGVTCHDIKECTLGSHGCSEHAACEDVPGSYKCTCHRGYEGDGFTCVDINECLDIDLYTCDEHSRCKNTNGGYVCVCDSGYTGHCDACEDIDECTEQLDNCDALHSVCENTAGGFTCHCDDGFSGDGVTCHDVDECADGLHQCDVIAECYNIPGSYHCQCMTGFTLTANNSCADVNECTTSENLCHPNAQCVNKVGTYWCVCQLGYIGDGFHCYDDTPGDCGNMTCDMHADCVQTDGGIHACQCAQGYTGPGYSVVEGQPGCTRLDPCDGMVCSGDAVCISYALTARCYCNPGYRGDGQVCVRNDPCVYDVFLCGEYSTCVTNTSLPDAYTCVCHTGYHKLLGSEWCSDVDECVSTDPCPPNSYCENEAGGYTCHCEHGYTASLLDQDTCVDMDECEQGTDDCDDADRAECVNSEGGYHCTCLYPYTGDGTFCTEVSGTGCGEQCGAGQYCNTAASTCLCITGYTQHNSTTCQDIDDCSETSPCDSNAVCTNNAPGYQCECVEGYYGNGVYCEDVDECARGTHLCDRLTSVCVNTAPDYNCTCKRGHSWQQYLQQCVLIPAGEDVCECGLHGVCDSVSGRCYCDHGYQANYTRITNKCEDVDDCPHGDKCHIAAICTDYVGGYSCRCRVGMRGDGYHYCILDECLSGTHQCHPNAFCTSTDAHYTCTCHHGYTGDGYNCTKLVDACELRAQVCGENALCVSRPGGQWQCQCQDGYYGDGEMCIDINECEIIGPLQHNCDEHAVCINTPGRYVCVCGPGYSGNGRFCEDIDECGEVTSHSSGPCSGNSDCHNTVGGYRCPCKPGLQADADRCKPVVGCGGVCGSHAECASTEFGGHVCHCLSGYTGDAYTTCTDIDECDEGIHTCKDTADCVNTAGGHTCQCKLGYLGNSKDCQDIDECASSEDTCVGDNMSCVNTPGSYHCNCEHGYQSVNNTCVDVDECVDGHGCHGNATCGNIPGGYKCECHDGYYGDGAQCTACPDLICELTCASGYVFNGVGCDDVDECAVPRYSIYAHQCVNAECHNTIKGYICNCLGGYELADELTCTDIDECAEDSRTCSPGQCINTPGSHICYCEDGYHSISGGCEDVDECLEEGVCGELGSSSCANSPGGYTCTCMPRYRLTADRCTDIDECVEDVAVCGQDSVCINMPGSHMCVCSSGYTLGTNNTCHDVDECLEVGACHENAECTNNVGSYTCQCREGYIGDGHSCLPVCAVGACHMRQTCHVVAGLPNCECRCEGPECHVPGRVCGSDGNTYMSAGSVRMYACEAGRDISTVYRGQCQASCSDVDCSHYKVCEVGYNDVPRCQCERCTTTELNSGYVCSVGGVTYPNLCRLKRHQCAIDGNDTVQRSGSCHTPTDCEYSAWTPWSACSVTCGMGMRTRSHSVAEEAQYGGQPCGSLTQNTHCYNAPCAADLCMSMVCERPGSVCVELYRPMCVCVSCEYTQYSPVCGLLGERMVTAPSLCRLQKDACISNTEYKVLHDGPCADGESNAPLQCTVMRHYRKVSDSHGCVTRDTIQTNTCSGGCGARTGRCCEPSRVRYSRQLFVCPQATQKIQKVAKVTRCRCYSNGRTRQAPREVIET